MAVLIPFWYYQFGSVIYAIATFVGILLSYYSYKLYEMGAKRMQMFFYLGFVFITAGMFSMALANIYSYVNLTSCQPVCEFSNISQAAYSVIRFGNYAYYLATLVGYGLIALSYLGTKRRLLLAIPFADLQVLYPFVNSSNPSFQLFHFLSMLILAYISLKTVYNYNLTKSKFSMYVMMGFIFIGAYHFMMFLVPLSETFFALAHLSMLLGFGLLLYMLLQVNKR